jgi:hypothetical protein
VDASVDVVAAELARLVAGNNKLRPGRATGVTGERPAPEPAADPPSATQPPEDSARTSRRPSGRLMDREHLCLSDFDRAPWAWPGKTAFREKFGAGVPLQRPRAMTQVGRGDLTALYERS